MNSENLKTASLYINNQLLCRGLLRHGRNIDFTLLESSNDTADTAASIMGVVNNLILLRDRDATQRENSSETIRTLRADVMKLSAELERLRGVNSDINRRLAFAEVEKKSAEGRLRASESKERALRANVERIKNSVSQVRTMCAVDCRKREKIIDGLKKVVSESGYVRGGKTPKTREIVIVGDIGEDHCATIPMSLEMKHNNLRSETNEYLTEYARGLSEENENLTRLAQWTLDTMKEMTGWDPSQNNKNNSNSSPAQTDPKDLSTETEAVIEHIRTLLTSPSFVSLEELEVREEEIIQLRKGWEHMEKRWRELVGMIDGWRKRILRGGENVNLEELKMGLRLGPKMPHYNDSKALQLSILQECSSEDEDTCERLINIPEKSPKFEGNTQPESDDDNEDNDNYNDYDNKNEDDYDDEDDVMSVSSSLYQENQIDEYVKEEENTEPSILDKPDIKQNTASSINSSSTTQISPLHETQINITPGNHSPPQRQRPCSPISEEDTIDLLQLCSSPISGTKSQSDAKSACSTQKTLSPSDAKSACSYERGSIPPDEAVEAHPKTSSQPLLSDFTIIKSRLSPSGLSGEPTSSQSLKSSQQTQGITPYLQPSPPQQQSQTSTPYSQHSQSRQPTRETTLNSQPYQANYHSRKKSNSPSKSHVDIENASLPISRVLKPAVTPKLKLGSDCRLPRPRNMANPQSPLTLANIAAKLAASEREANAARVRAKLRAARSDKNVIDSVDKNRLPSSRKENNQSQQTPIKNTSKLLSNTCDNYNKASVDECQLEINNMNRHGNSEALDIFNSVKPNPNYSSRKRKARDIAHKETGKSRRRRSTLSPWELERVIRGEPTSEEKRGSGY